MGYLAINGYLYGPATDFLQTSQVYFPYQFIPTRVTSGVLPIPVIRPTLVVEQLFGIVSSLSSANFTMFSPLLSVGWIRSQSGE